MIAILVLLAIAAISWTQIDASGDIFHAVLMPLAFVLSVVLLAILIWLKLRPNPWERRRRRRDDDDDDGGSGWSLGGIFGDSSH